MAGEESIRKKDIYFRLWRAFRCSTNEDVTSYEVDELAFDVFQTYRGLALSERICGRRFGDLKDAGYIKDVGTRESNPEMVAHYADSPVTEADLHARHRFLMFSDVAREAFSNVATDPEYFDARLAGWWVWGQCCWIGGGWCTGAGTRFGGTDSREQIPELKSKKGVQQVPDLAGDAGAFGRGVVSSAGHNKKPPLLNANFDDCGTGVHAKRPCLATDRETRGVVTLAGSVDTQLRRPNIGDHKGVAGRPQLGDAYDIGRGVNSNGSAGTCQQRREWLTDWMFRLADRLCLVRICYGHWSRVCDSNTTLTRLGETAVFLDPPYAKNVDRLQAILRGEDVGQAASTNRAASLYANDGDQDVDLLVAEVNQWCQKWGSNPQIRIALCGYEGEHNNLEELGWESVAWKAQGGYGNRNAENLNKHRERIWYSPACVLQPMLF